MDSQDELILPIEILLVIGSFLDFPTAVCFFRTCRYLYGRKWRESITELDVSKMRRKYMDNGHLLQFPNVTKIKLDTNLITTKGLEKLTKLVELETVFESIKDVHHLSTLTKLTFGDKNFYGGGRNYRDDSFPTSLKSLKTGLFLSDYPKIGDLTNLTYLHLLPDGFGKADYMFTKLTNLRELHIEGDRYVTDDIWNHLPNLEILDVRKGSRSILQKYDFLKSDEKILEGSRSTSIPQKYKTIDLAYI